MSRIGRNPIVIPSGVTVLLETGRATVRGPKGEVAVPIHPNATVTLADGAVQVTVARPTVKVDRALWGLTARLFHNAVLGVTQEFSRQLEVHGVGFRADVKGNALEFALGFSHPIRFPIPPGITAAVEKQTITLRGVDKQLVGETAARVRRLREPDAYHGKGIRYAGEVLKLKPGKAAKAGAAAK